MNTIREEIQDLVQMIKASWFIGIVREEIQDLVQAVKDNSGPLFWMPLGALELYLFLALFYWWVKL